MARNPPNKLGPKRTTVLASDILDRLGAKPLDEIHEAMLFAKKRTYEGGNVSDKGVSDQAQFLAAWIKAAELLSKFKFPVLSAVAVKDVSDNRREPMTSKQALDVIRQDPFFPKDITTEMTVSALKQTEDLGNVPLLVEGKKE